MHLWRFEYSENCLTFHLCSNVSQYIRKCVYCSQHRIAAHRSERLKWSNPVQRQQKKNCIFNNATNRIIWRCFRRTSPTSASSFISQQLGAPFDSFCSSSQMSISMDACDTKLHLASSSSSCLASSKSASSLASNSLQSSLRKSLAGDRFCGVTAKWFSSGDFNEVSVAAALAAVLEKLVISEPSAGVRRSGTLAA